MNDAEILIEQPIITDDDLAKTGFKIVKTFSKIFLPFSEMLDNYLENPYKHLENYPHSSFEFIKFQDQEIVITNGEKTLHIFGKNYDFLFGFDIEQTVWIVYRSSGEIRYVTQSLSKFIDAYALFLSTLFYLKINCFKPSINGDDENDYNAYYAQIAKEFHDKLMLIDQTIFDFEYSFFDGCVGMIEENYDIPNIYHPTMYLKTQRTKVNI